MRKKRERDLARKQQEEQLEKEREQRRLEREKKVQAAPVVAAPAASVTVQPFSANIGRAAADIEERRLERERLKKQLEDKRLTEEQEREKKRFVLGQCTACCSCCCIQTGKGKI